MCAAHRCSLFSRVVFLLFRDYRCYGGGVREFVYFFPIDANGSPPLCGLKSSFHFIWVQLVVEHNIQVNRVEKYSVNLHLVALHFSELVAAVFVRAGESFLLAIQGERIRPYQKFVCFSPTLLSHKLEYLVGKRINALHSFTSLSVDGSRWAESGVLQFLPFKYQHLKTVSPHVFLSRTIKYCYQSHPTSTPPPSSSIP